MHLPLHESLLHELTILRIRIVIILALIHIHFLFGHFLNNAHLILSSNFIVGVLALLDLTVDTFDFEGVLLRLGLEVFDLNDHLLQLLASFLERLFVDYKLFGYFRAALFC